MATAVGASTVKTWLRLGHSVKGCNPSPEQHCTGSLGEAETLCQGNAKLLWWFIHLGWLCWRAQIFSLLVNSTCLHDPVCYWPLLLTPKCCAATECFLYSSASSAVPEYAAVLENFPGEGHWGCLEAAMQKCRAGLCRRCSLGNFTTMETCLQREKGLFYWHQMLLPPSTHDFEKKTGVSAWAKVDNY